MKTERLSGLVQRVKQGDRQAAHNLHQVLRPVVSREVRRILQTEEFTSPLGQRVRGLLSEFGGASSAWTSNLDSTAQAITQRICGQTLSTLTVASGKEACAADTVWV
jgi:hypothetical protein